MIPERPGDVERYVAAVLHALVISNMRPDQAHPERGSFVRDQVSALRRLEGLEVELHEFAPGSRELARAPLRLRRHYAGRRLDVVHAHFGLSAWPALAIPARVHALTMHGTDAHHPLTRTLTRLALPLLDLIAAASPSLAAELPGGAARRRAQVLPCGVDIERFRPLTRESARAQLGLRAEGPYLLFPADPQRTEKRYDRALAVAGDVPLLTLSGIAPAQAPLWVNAANAVLVPSEREGFGLAVLEALACDVPVLATPVGVHADALAGIPGTLCATFDAVRWREALVAHVQSADPRVPGRARAEEYSAARFAERVERAWRDALLRAG
jgi:glycosyltransferase involved in cell wall biosynthesis